MRIAATLVLLLLSVMGAAEDRSWLSQSGAYRIHIQSEINPLPINRIHRWIVHVETASGETVDDAVLTLSGGMPLHDHGLPTVPRMTAALGNGDYRFEGIRFHMHGAWELNLAIDVDGKSERVVIDLIV